jgi:hypothetical protein
MERPSGPETRADHTMSAPYGGVSMCSHDDLLGMWRAAIV